MTLNPRHSHRFTLLGITLELATSDDAFLDEFASVFGGRGAAGPCDLPAATLTASLDAPVDGWGEIIVTGDDLRDPAAFLLGFSSPTIPLKAADADEAEWTALAIGDDPDPVFRFRESVCRFRDVPRWRRIVAHYLFLRMLSMRQEALFFHAASIGIGGRGVLLIGPKGSGKSTLSVGLAARGHMFLGDETAAYVPRSRTLLPFRRPAGIKPGPRAEAVSKSLERVQPRADEEGMLRVDVGELFELAPATPLPLDAVVFLGAFGDTPRLEAIQAGRDELSMMQPIATSLASAPGTSRVFEMIRLLGSVRCFKMTAGTPDQSIQILEEAFSA